MSTKTDNDALLFLSQQLGLALLSCQLAERMLRACLVRAFPRTPAMSGRDLLNLDAKSRKATLGRLFKALREHWKPPADFARMVDDFFDHRSALVDRFFDVTGFSIGDREGIAAGVRYAGQVRREADGIRTILSPFVETWIPGALTGGSLRLPWTEIGAASAFARRSAEDIEVQRCDGRANARVERPSTSTIRHGRVTRPAGRPRDPR